MYVLVLKATKKRGKKIVVMKVLRWATANKVLIFVLLLLAGVSLTVAGASAGSEVHHRLAEVAKEAAENIYTRPEKAIELSNEAQRLAKDLDNQEALLSALLTAGLAHMRLGNALESREYLEQSREIARRIGSFKGEGDAENHLGTIYFEQSQFDRALQHYVKALELRKAIDDKVGMSKTINNMGRVHHKLGNYDKAIALFREALLVKPENDQSGRVNTLNNLGLVYRSQGDIPAAMAVFQEALQLAESISSVQGIAYSMLSLGDTYKMTGQLAIAERYTQDALAHYESIQYTHGVAYTLFRAGVIYAEMGDAAKALDYYERSERSAEQIKQKGLLRDIAWEKARLFEAAMDLPQALLYLHKYISLQEAILNSDLHQKILILQNQHELEAKAKEIELLQKGVTLKDAQLKNQWLLLAAVATFLAASMVVALFLYRQNKWRKNKEQELLAVTVSLEEANQRLSQLADTDFLTRLANRRRFNKDFVAACRQVAQGQGDLAVILVDVDFFKEYNDHHGHLQGDECLVRVAAVLQDTFPSEECLVARYGGEEFIVLVKGDCSQAQQYAEMARRQIEDINLPHMRSAFGRVTCSFGFACFDHRGMPQELISWADKALYEAKRSGRNKVVWFGFGSTA